MIPFSRPTTGQEELDAVARVMKSGQLAYGPEASAFEEEFSIYISPPGEHYHCIFTNSCTSALKMAYKWAKENHSPLDDGFDGVVVPKNTYCATSSSAAEMGLDCMFHDEWKVTPDDDGYYGFNRSRVNVHYGSIKDETPCLIEDSAHRIEPNDPLVGKIRCYSFHATKNMTTGSGGMFVTNDPDIVAKARLWANDGRVAEGLSYKVVAYAGGYEGNDIAAAIGREQLQKLPMFTAFRNTIVELYNRGFGTDWTGNHIYPFMVDRLDEVDSLRRFLLKNGVETSYHYPDSGWLGVSLPLYPTLKIAEVEKVIRLVKEWRG